MYIFCECYECKNNKDGECKLDEISIRSTFHADAPAACDDFEEE